MHRDSRGEAAGEQRAIVYCLIPFELAPRLHDLLRDHFRGDPGIEVVVERRRGERRGGGDRRIEAPGAEVPEGKERRRIRGHAGRRVGERRVMSVPVSAPPLPRRARRHAERITFVERLEPADAAAADLQGTRLAIRAQGGDTAAFTELYTRYFDRVYRYMRVALRNSHDAEDATQQVFVNVIGALPEYEPRRPFGAWLFTIARNHVVNRLRRAGRLEVVDPETLERHAAAEPQRDAGNGFDTLDWISDRDLSLFVERLPEPQRQVLVLRYVLGFETDEIAQILERNPDDVRKPQSRAQRFLRDRLTNLRRAPQRAGRRTRMRIRPRQATVLRARRFSLH